MNCLVDVGGFCLLPETCHSFWYIKKQRSMGKAWEEFGNCEGNTNGLVLEWSATNRNRIRQFLTFADLHPQQQPSWKRLLPWGILINNQERVRQNTKNWKTLSWLSVKEFCQAECFQHSVGFHPNISWCCWLKLGSSECSAGVEDPQLDEPWTTDDPRHVAPRWPNASPALHARMSTGLLWQSMNQGRWRVTSPLLVSWRMMT